jgi:hypothetical protein
MVLSLRGDFSKNSKLGFQNWVFKIGPQANLGRVSDKTDGQNRHSKQTLSSKTKATPVSQVA